MIEGMEVVEICMDKQIKKQIDVMAKQMDLSIDILLDTYLRLMLNAHSKHLSKSGKKH